MFNHAIAYLMSVVTDVKREENGASAVEYAILVAAIIAVVTAAVAAIGTGLTDRFTDLFA